MRVKKFEDFTESLKESSFERGKTPFSRWLRDMDSRIAIAFPIVTSKSTDRPDYRTGALASTNNVIPALARLVLKGGAAISDFFFREKDKKKLSKMSKEELEAYRSKAIENWEEENIKGKDITEKDAEDFYKSGVLKGKKYFGSGYDPKSPKGDDQKEYTQYLQSAMKKYYENLK